MKTVSRWVAWLVAVMALAAIGLIPVRADEARPQFRVVPNWPQLPEGKTLGSAAGVGVNSEGHVLVFHRAERVWSELLPLEPIAAATVAVFDGKTGRLIREWGAGQFAMPHGLTVDGDDNVWLTDVALHQVFKFSADGRLLLTVGERGVPGADDRHFNRPTDVAVLPDGSFYVSDGYRNTRVAKFSTTGTFEFAWGGAGDDPGAFDTPHAIAVDAQNRVYVADRENDRVQVFDAKGRFLRQWKGKAIGRPYSVALLGSDAVVVDGGEQPRFGPDRSGAALVDKSGIVRSSFGRWGSEPGAFRMAHDVAVGSDGALYIVEITGRRVQKFGPVR